MNATHEQFIKASTDLLKPLNDESDRFAPLLATLQVIATELEQSSLTFKDVSNFHKRAAVVDALKRLEQQFSSDLG